MRVEQENVLTQMQLQISNSVFIPTRATLLESLVSFPQSRKDYFYTLRQRHWRFVNNRYNVSCECFETMFLSSAGGLHRALLHMLLGKRDQLLKYGPSLLLDAVSEIRRFLLK